MDIGIIGTGFIGLVAGASLASSGNQVLGYDIDVAKIEALSQGEFEHHEPGLRDLIQQQVKRKRLRFTSSIEETIAHGQVLFITVPTPARPDGAADLSQLADVATKVGDALDGFKIIVIKSTAPVGTASFVNSIIASRTTEDFAVVANPEFLREGSALRDFQDPERVIIGADDPRARKALKRLYRPFIRRERILLMDPRSAEMTKYATNAMLALRVSFINELSKICEVTNANIESVRLGLESDARIGKGFLFPGIGYGGACFPKDIEALINLAKQYDTEAPILEAAQKINARQRLCLIEKLDEHYDGKLEGRCVAIWGATYKPQSDDLRESPALFSIQALLDRGVKLRVFDPVALDKVRALFPHEQLTCVDDEYEALEGADALLIATGWNQFKTPDFEKIRGSLRDAVIFDGRNLYDPKIPAEHGLLYYSIGRRDPDSIELWEQRMSLQGSLGDEQTR